MKMNVKLSRILDKCIEQLHRGENIESCLLQYPQLREQLEPLLKTAQAVSALPRVLPSDEFRRASKTRLMARIREDSVSRKTVKARPRTTLLDELALSWQRIWQAFIGAKKVAVPVTLALLLILAIGIPSALNFLSATPALASQCTLSILSGSVEVQEPGAEHSQPGADGMTLAAGTRVKTASNSHALLTFFEGSTFKLESNSDVEIQQIEITEGQPTTIVLKQWLGKTWSRVVQMADPGSHYRIDTPSATAIVRGTLFTTEVEASGSTRVTTTEGLVSVLAQGEEVYLPASQQARVEAGAIPSQPVTIPSPTAEIVVNVTMPAVGSVIDPTGSSTGILPSGLFFNQILGSQSSSPSADTQLITITEPVTGEYIIALRYLTEGQARFSIQGASEGKAVFNFMGNWGGTEEGGWLIHLDIQVENGQIVSSEITYVESLGEKAPEEIVEVPLAIGEGATITTQDSDTGDPPDVDQGEPEGKGESEDKGKPEDNEKPEDKGKPDEPEDKGKPDEPEDRGEPEKPADKGKPDEPEDRGEPDEPEDKGKPDKPGDRGKPDKPGDKGKPDKPGDKGKPDKPEDKGEGNQDFEN